MGELLRGFSPNHLHFNMDEQVAIEMIKHLLQENKELKEQLEIAESILHSYLPIVEDKS